jgi:hypothetical protein
MGHSMLVDVDSTKEATNLNKQHNAVLLFEKIVSQSILPMGGTLGGA